MTTQEFILLHQFAQYLIPKNIELINWRTGDQLGWGEAIEEFKATKSTPEIVHQEGYDFQQAKENKEQAK